MQWYPLLFKLVGGGMWALLGALAVLASRLTTQHSAVVSVLIILLRNGLPYLGSFIECALKSTSLLVHDAARHGPVKGKDIECPEV